MKRILHIFLVLSALFAGIYLLPIHASLFECFKPIPVFEILSIMLLTYVLYLYRREREQIKEMLTRLSQKNLFLDLAVQGGNIHIWEYKDAEFVFEYAIGELPFRLKREEMWKLIHPDDLTSFKLLEQSLWKANKKIFQCRTRFNGPNYEWWEFRFSAIPTAAKVEGNKKVSGLLVNIDDMKRREEELVRAKGHEQKFLANMSHEIRTPLNAIVGFSSLLASDDNLDETEKQVFITTINRNCDLLLVLINDILEISRLESGQMRFEKKECSVKELVDSLYHVHKLLVPAHLRFLKEEGEDLLIYTDNNRLTQVLANFLTNACKFTEHGYIKLGFKYLRGTDEVAIFVEDSGIGMSKEQQEKVFSRFCKLDEFSQGAGLGLSICQGIVENLGGRIGVSSKQGEGSRFTVLLPVYQQRYF